MKLVRILSEFQENSKSFQSLTDIATPNKIPIPKNKV